MRKFVAGLAAPFTPASLPGYLFEYNPASLVNSGGAVSQWSDVSGNGYHQVASGAHMPVYTASALNGLPGATSAGLAHMQSVGSIPWASPQAMIYLVARYTNAALGLMFESTVQASQNNAQWYLTGGVANNLTLGSDHVNFPGNVNQYQAIVLQYDRLQTQGGTFTHHWGRSRTGFSTPVAASSTNLPTDILSLFSRQPTLDYVITGTFVHMIGYRGLHSEADIQRNVEFLSSAYAINTTAPSRALYVDGDSISSTYGSPSPWTGHVVLDGYFPGTVVSSCAFSSKKLVQAYASLSVQLGTVKSGLVSDAIVFLGTNDFANSITLTVSTLYNSYLVPYVQALKSAGYRNVGVATMLPRSAIIDQSPTAFETLREGTGGWNPTIRAGASTNGYTVIDVGSDAAMGNAANTTNTTYYVDQVHPTDLGQSILYNSYVKPTLTAWG